MNQDGDVSIFQTDNDGNISVKNGLFEMSGGLESSVYLSLFGGNDDDDGLENNRANWWGNFQENENAFKYRSETQNLLKSLPISSANLLKVKAAVLRDLQWMIDKKVASEISASVTVPKLNRVKITVSVDAYDDIIFLENWNNDARNANN